MFNKEESVGNRTLSIEQDLKESLDQQMLIIFNGSSTDYTRTVDFCKKKADEGDHNAILWTARMYRDGKGVEKDLDMAAEWMRKAVKNKTGNANNELFDILWRIGTIESYNEMISIATDFANIGDGEAMGRLGRAYRYGKGVENNLNEAAKWMRKAAEKNIGWSNNELFDILWRIGTIESYNEMISIATDFANIGDGEAMVRLGRAYRDGKGVEKNLNEAAEWMRKAAEKNIGWANNELFDILWRIGTIESYNEMISIATDFANMGDGEAMGRLGRAYRYGKGVEKDLIKSVDWMCKAAEKTPIWEKELVEIVKDLFNSKFIK